jgi:hypothetical protein
MDAPSPINENERLRPFDVMRSWTLLPKPAFDRITRLVSRLLNVQMYSSRSFVGKQSDVTERTLKEEALLQSYDKLKQL